MIILCIYTFGILFRAKYSLESIAKKGFEKIELTMRRVDPQVDRQVGDALVGAGHPVRLVLDLLSGNKS